MASESDLPKERDELYGDAAAVTGQVVALLRPESERLLSHAARLWFPWIMILNKLIRAAHSPTYHDHWRDIIGYAQLALRYIGDEENGQVC